MLLALIQRNTKLYFKDKGMFFSSLITPLILLVLFVTFLGDVYRDMLFGELREKMALSDDLINGGVGSYLMSSLFSVCCVTVSFMSNLVMVQDKVTGARKDLTLAPVRNATLALSYYCASVIAALTVILVLTAAGFCYLAVVGWYLSFGDVLWVLLDVILLTLFGTSLSSVIHFFLKSQGQITAVSATISAGYGFLCGAYMPLSNYGEGLRNGLSLFPGNHGTTLTRNHMMRGIWEEMDAQHVPQEVIDTLQENMSCQIHCFDHSVSVPMMYVVLVGAVLVLTGVYTLLCKCRRR